MDLQQQNESVFSAISPSFVEKMFNEVKIVQSFFSENTTSQNTLILTLTKNYIVARSNLNNQIDKMYSVQITFDLKFQIIYFLQRNVQSKKIGIRFLNSPNEFNCFYTSNLETIQTWTLNLSKLINQKGFHDLFRPIKKLGKGNFASVYEVERISDLRRFAVKAFSKQNTFAAKNGKESLINELSIMRLLNHQNVLRLEGVFESDNSIYVVLEVLHGDQLFHKIQKTKGYFSKAQIKNFMKGLLEGLANMHENRIMHRDLKPENIMLRDENLMTPVIVDFGLATNADLPKYLFYRCGTPGYVAPEIVTLTENVHIQPKCDVFSAGVIFHILLTRKPLFEGTKYDQVYRNNKQMNFNLQSQIYEKLQAEELELLKNMLKQNPSERISASEALKKAYFSDINQDLQTASISPPMTNTSMKSSKIKKLIKF